MAGEEIKTGTRDEHYNLISTLYHLLQGASTCEQYIRDAEEAGDQELVQFFKDWQEEQRNLSERAKNLLGSRMLNAKAGVGGGQRRVSAREAGAGVGREQRVGGGTAALDTRAPSNASVKSGGNEQDDIVDEQSKESFPASDSPAKY